MPVSAKKQAANRANALKSTGPRTPAGKARSSRNALRHGPASIGIIVNLRSENIADLHAIRGAMSEQYDPQNIQEKQLIEIISNAYIRLQRAEEISTALLDGSLDTIQQRNNVPLGPTSDDAFGCAVALTDKETTRAWQNVERYRTRASIDYHRAVETLNRLQTARRDEPGRARNRQRDDDAYRRRTTARTLTVLTRPDDKEENKANNEPTSRSESTQMASILNFPATTTSQIPSQNAAPVTPSRAANAQTCDNKRTPTTTTATIPPNRALSDSNR